MKASAQNIKQKQPLQTKDQVFKPQGPATLRKLTGVKTYPQGVNPPDNFFQLDKVIGLSSRGSTSIAVNSVNGEIAYPAGAIICIYSPKENKQTKFLYSMQQQRSYSCLAFSPDGKYLAAGEGAFRQPEITIWEIDKDTGEYKEIKHLRGHKYGIESVMFSPNMLYLISLGDANDRGLFVWDWRTESRVTSNKLGKPVNTFAFSSLNSFFVTAGYQHLKYWYFDEHGKVQKTIAQGAAGNSTESIMESKSADLAKVKVKIFVGVQCVANGGQSGKEEQVIALASDGHLFVYDKNRKLNKWMNIKVDRAMNCILGGDHLYCACNDGIVRIFSAKSLEHIMTLPKPPPLGQANVESGSKKIRIPANKDSRFADALAVLVDEKNQRIVVLYSDRMIFIWDVSKMDKISVYRTLFSHSGPIYDLQYIPNSLQIGFQIPHDQPSSGGLGQNQILTEDEMTSITKFATCSADRTIRFWNFADPSSSVKTEQLNKILMRNAYSKDMSRLIYVSNIDPRDPNSSQSQPQNQFEYFKVKPISLNEDGSPKQDVSLAQQQQRELEQLRCIKISPDGKHLACGDWTGNIRVHDLQQNSNSSLYSTYDEIQCIQAHDSEVVCLDYSPMVGGNTNTQGQNIFFGGNAEDSSGQNKYWLASGSRDRLTHIYEYNSSTSNYQNVAILDDHSSTITSINFAEERSLNGMKKRLKLISSGADKQIVVRSIQPAGTNFMSSIANTQTDAQSDGVFQTWLLKKEQCKHKVLSMDIAGGYGISGHDKYVQLWQVTTPTTSGFDKLWDRKADSQKKSSVLDHVRVLFGPSNQTGLGSPHQPGCEIVIASCADKSVTIYETATGNAIAKTTCGEVTTAMCLSTNLKHLITASMDGIIYFWRLPENLTKALVKLRSEQPLTAVKTEAPKLPLKFQSPLQNQMQQPIPDENLRQDGMDGEQERKHSNFEDSQFERDYMDESSIADQSQYNQQPPPSISLIMQQINQVTSKIEKIQPLKNRNQHFQNTAQTEIDQDAAITDPSNQASQVQKRRNVWGAKTSPTRPPPQTADGFDNSMSPQIPAEESDEGVRALHFKDNKLPRWAQSMAGINNANEAHNQPDGQHQDHPFNEMKRDLSGVQENINDVDDIFEGTLEKIPVEESKHDVNAVSHGVFYRSDSQIQQQIVEEYGAEEDITPVKSQVPPKPIDFLNTMNDKQMMPDEDPDEAIIREQLRLRNMQHKLMLGLDSEDEDSDCGEHKSQHVESSRLMRRPSENRQSQSQLFLQRKKEQQHLDVSSSAAKKESALKVEDIFNESSPAEQPNLLQQKRIEEPPQNRYQDEKQDGLQNTVHSLVNQVEAFTDLDDKPHESLTSDAMVKIIEKQKTEEEIKELNANKLLQEEIAKINQSLFRINQCLNGIKVGESSHLNLKIKDEVSQSFNQSLDLWNNVAFSLGKKPVPMPQPSESHQNIKIPQHNESSSNMSMAPSSLINQSMPLSQAISIKDDARDLLERYSDLLMAEVIKKISAGKQV